KYSLSVLLGTGILISGAFQNCAKVPLETPPILPNLIYASGTANFCLDQELSAHTVESAIAINVNLIPFETGLLLDSDADGLPDRQETLFGFDPLKRRSKSNYTDGICLSLSNGSGCQDTVV